MVRVAIGDPFLVLVPILAICVVVANGVVDQVALSLHQLRWVLTLILLHLEVVGALLLAVIVDEFAFGVELAKDLLSCEATLGLI